MRSFWWALKRKWAADKPFTGDGNVSVTLHAGKDVSVSMWESGGRDVTIGLNVGKVSMLMSAARFGRDHHTCDETLDFLCRLQRATEEAIEAAKESHKRGHR